MEIRTRKHRETRKRIKIKKGHKRKRGEEVEETGGSMRLRGRERV